MGITNFKIKIARGGFIALLILGGITSASTDGTGTTNSTAPSVKLGPNGRYLVDQNNIPFMIVGDSPQALIANASEAQADAYFADRQAHGFNAVWINLLCDSYTFCNSNGTTSSSLPTGEANLAPFTSGSTPSNYDISKPNAAYFQRAHAIIQDAASHGLIVFLDPIETGGWLTTLENNGLANATSYGQYLATTFGDLTNIIWLSGNDFQSYTTVSDNNLVQAVAQAVKTANPAQLQTSELSYLISSSLDDTDSGSIWPSILGLNAAYTYSPTYAEVLHAFNQSTANPMVIPTFLEEANYEFEQNGGTDGGTTQNVRLQEYWTMLSGGTGQIYASCYTDRDNASLISSSTCPLAGSMLTALEETFPSTAALDTTGVTQLGYWKDFFTSRAWYNLVPDQNHAFVTAGYGNFVSSGEYTGNNYVTSALTPDGTLGMAYLPQGGTITVNMTQLQNNITARWFDPSNGTYTAISGSPFTNINSQNFTTPGKNSSGNLDWVLVLETAPPTTYLLTVLSSGAGSGTVTSNPSGISCPSTCSDSFNNGTSVTLTATASTGSTFIGWSGACSGTGACTVTSTATVTAAFTSAGGSSSINFVQLAQSDLSSTSNKATATFTSNNTAGDLLVAWLWYNSSTVDVSSITDSAGNTYTKITGPTLGVGNLSGWSQELWYAKNINAGSAVTVTATFSATFSGEKAIAVHEYNGADTASPLDVSTSAVGKTANASVSATTTAGNELIFGAGLFTTSGTAGAGFTQRSSLASNVTEDEAGTSAAGSNAVSFTNTAQNWIAQAVTFKQASSQPTYPITVSNLGTGFGMVFGSATANNNLINCGVNTDATLCSATVNPGTVVTLTATAASESTFSGWAITGSPAGTCTGTTSPCTITVSAATSVSATFTSTSTTPVNCVGSWGACSVACGGGTETYTITTPAEDGGTSCPAANGATQSCNNQACPVTGKISFVQLAQSDLNLKSSTTATTFTANNLAGDLFVVWLWYNSSTLNVTSITDSVGNTYIKAVGPSRGAGGLSAWSQELWYAKNIMAGSNVKVTATFSGTFSGEKAIAVHEYNGADTASPLDVSTSAVGTTANASVSATTTAGNELIFGAGLFTTSGTAGAGFTQRSSLDENVTEDNIAASSGTNAATFKNSRQNWIAQMAGFKAAS